MDLEVKGVAASPQRQVQLSTRGKKYQGWRPDTRATRGPRPPEVPCLDLGRLRDSDEEDGDSYVPYSGSYLHACPLDSSSDWRILQKPYTQHYQAQQHSVLEQKTIPENLLSTTDRYKLKYQQYEADMKEEYKQYSQRTAEKKNYLLQCPEASIKGTQLKDGHNDDLTALDEKALLQQCYTSKPYKMLHSIRKSEAEDVAAERRKQAVIEQVMVDQLSRAVISDPEQSMPADVYKEAQGLLRTGTAPMCLRKRTLHETKIRTKSGLTENMLSNKLRFDSRIISRSLTVYEFRQFGKNRTNALPFIQKGVYQHQRGQKKEKAYDLSDFYIGANLTFRSADHNLPESVKQKPIFTLRVISIDEAAMDSLKASMEFKQECSQQVVDDSKVFKKIQGILRETLSKRGVRVITGIGKYFRQVDKNRNGFLSQAAFKEALKLFRLEIPEGDFESLWLILDDSNSDKVDYGEFTRAAFGEMNEYRKAFVRKAYMKLDFNKTGSVPMVDIRKCYCAKKHPLVLAGKATEEEIKSSFLETLGESCSNPNEVSYSEFEDYYEGLSIGIMDDDDFVNILRNPWGI
ncbi:calcyphosin-2 isoform X5 [Pezoporus wallicus]|uniref:calcyphosin-2 isoform X5 n=1 Tax=Pezoporus wallicus TaxID=35540 RepID=UPI00254CE6EE|nr:calcyphosin-2 isoform X5 [Pezoporus wallicus]XP_061310743.1 calcyphosin-2 isoform X5 [Pezoporus flaviventris]